ncbi:hypothetical protein AAZX31_16G090400 [Glycine max]|uniref:Uncharacterized protein n=3 Tax=Glycine subgen. Soja TaxID=1462606 RepID=A0A0R0FNS8_SOYBN|nr:uncharacterized protein LOC102670326 [Glycine max]XP_028205504.1 uncharacterized protein LOC114389105 [Glycine soja]KAG4938846.1 hypothetical protein JHK86_044987 [Glycine max]KAG4940911.1 hypothetical protein JHK87_044782 [Glycine soja]KAG4951686.1 hypothetical protein JHK85_045553 [Glycine max]KAG5099532.1 hypothetical protein JHK82_044584 [Glycine max]KAG5108131.1 hypothetical protein JHK84_045038 [Glycine max]|eukprot:XP_006599233.1 uncharacterized protein LOC102670326 [Glycine max]
MPVPNSTHFTSMRDQVDNLFKELKEIHDKFLALMIALVAAKNSDTGNSLFAKQHKLMISLVLALVLYSFLATLGTILHTHNNRNTNLLLPIITCAMLMLGIVVSILALSFISTTVAWMTLTIWVGIFTLIAYEYGALKEIRNWIKGHITRD